MSSLLSGFFMPPHCRRNRPTSTNGLRLH